MKAKVINQRFEEYGQIIDVVLNQYMGKYTDGKKQYPKEALSFDVEEEPANGDFNNELKEYAFRILCAKEASHDTLKPRDEIVAEIDYAYGVAKAFQICTDMIANGMTDIQHPQAPEETVEIANHPQEEVKQVPTEETKPKELKVKRGRELIKKAKEQEEASAKEEEPGLSDLLAELNN